MQQVFLIQNLNLQEFIFIYQHHLFCDYGRDSP